MLFTAKTPQDLLDQIQLVPHKTYLVHRNRLADAELPRQFFCRLHHDPAATLAALIKAHSIRSQDPEKQEPLIRTKEHGLHTS